MAKNNLIRRVCNGRGQINDSASFRITESQLSLLSATSQHCTQCTELSNSLSNKNDKKTMDGRDFPTPHILFQTEICPTVRTSHYHFKYGILFYIVCKAWEFNVNLPISAILSIMHFWYWDCRNLTSLTYGLPNSTTVLFNQDELNRIHYRLYPAIII